jgi:hypothetical protein
MNKPRGLRWSLGSCFGNARLLGYIKVPPPLLPSDNLYSVDLAIPIGARNYNRSCHVAGLPDFVLKCSSEIGGTGAEDDPNKDTARPRPS